MGNLNLKFTLLLCFFSLFCLGQQEDFTAHSRNSSIPEAMFTSNINAGCAPLTVQFTDMSTGDIDTLLWTFPGGNPSSSNEQNPLVIYETAGVYEVILRVANSAGADELEVVDYIQVFNKPTASFGFLPDMLNVSFQNTSTFFDSLLWDFGDGTMSTEENPMHLYPAEGPYTITLIAYGCENDTTMLSVNLLLSPTGGFGSDKTEGCAPLSVQFFDQSSGTVDSWSWSFEGGIPATSDIQNPLINYDQSGTFDVQLITTNATGSDTTFFENYITINPTPIGEFEFEVFEDSISFTNLSEFGDAYIWDFGDGDSSTLENPSHIYENPGVFNVILTVINDCGENSVLKKVIPAITPEADFLVEGNTTAGCVPFEVQFMDNSMGAISEWAWTFEGGIPLNSNMPNPLVTYIIEGSYPVRLIVTNQFGVDTIFMENVITVTNPPIADFDFTIDSNSVTFINNSEYQVVNFWDYGDGNTYNGTEQTHQYDSSGRYQVELVVANSCGLDTIFKEINIELTSRHQLLNPEKFELYPNPNDGSFVIDIEGVESQQLNISILNSLGQFIYSENKSFEGSNFKGEINLTPLPSGTYYVRISQNDKIISKRLIIFD